MATTPAATSLAVLEMAQAGQFAQIRLMFAPQLRPMTGIQLAPASAAEPMAPWEPPGYGDSGTFDERDLMAVTGPLAVPGTLSLPRQSGPRPAVVLLPGSGAVDRDQTIGRNKPFKDLAWGLATRGVAVLRFDKVTYAHPSEGGAA
jgi:hypothetical protein